MNVHTRVVGVLAVLAVSALASAAEWTSAPSMNTPRTNFGAAVDHRGNIVAVGGAAACNDQLASVERLAFDGASYAGSWSPSASMSVARQDVAVAMSAGFIIAIGGFDGEGAITLVERLDTTIEGATWEQIASLKVARMAAAAAVDRIGRVYVIGGLFPESADTGTVLNTVEVYDPARPELGWQFLEWSLNDARLSAGAATDALGRIYVIGGTGADLSEHLASVERFDPNDPEAGWVYVAPIIGPASNNSIAATGADGRVYVVGGWLPGYSARVVRYDPNDDSWEVWASLATPRSMPSVVLGRDGCIYAIGGDGAPGGCGPNLTSVEKLTAPCGVTGARAILLDTDGGGDYGFLDLTELLLRWGLCI